VRGGPFGVRVPSNGDGDGGKEQQQPAGPRDEVARWARVAEEAAGVDDENDGGGNDKARSAAAPSPEAAYVEANPQVAVVERMEDLWLLSRLQRDRNAAGR
jgi:hypothetical protein